MLRDKLARGHQVLAIVGMALDHRQEPDQKSTYIHKSPVGGAIACFWPSVLTFDAGFVSG